MGLGKVTVSNTSGRFKSYGGAKPITFYGGTNSNGLGKMNIEAGVTVGSSVGNIGYYGNFSKGSASLTENIGMGKSTLGIGVHYNVKDWSVGIAFSNSVSENDMESKTTVSVDIEIPKVVLAVTVTAVVGAVFGAVGVVAMGGIALFAI